MQVDSLIVAQILFVLVWVVGVLSQFFFLRLLRLRHTSTWQGLGSPSLIVNNSLRSVARLLRYIWKGQYEELGDSTLTALGRVFKLSLAFVCLLLIAILMTLVMEIWASG